MDETTPMTHLMDALGRQQHVSEDFRRIFIEDTRLEARDALRQIVAAYDASLQRDGAKIPTMLMCAIECARKVVE